MLSVIIIVVIVIPTTIIIIPAAAQFSFSSTYGNCTYVYIFNVLDLN